MADVDNVIETIVADIKSLEKNGIITHSEINLKASLVCVAFDNLGGNVLFGFSGGFNANFYCRICSSTREECQKMITENVSTLRTTSEYDLITSKLRSGAYLTLNEAKGIKSPCLLNNLENFHVLSNATVDLMHDVLEGAAGFAIENIIKFCEAQKIASIEELQTLV